MKGRRFRVFIFSGDGELQEGSVWEAAMSAARFELGNLIVIVDRNGLQLADRTEQIMPLEPLAAKWEAFGFETREVDGHDPTAMIEAIADLDLRGGKPHVLIARTIKGKGVSFIEDQAAWHHRIPVDDQVAQAIEQLE